MSETYSEMRKRFTKSIKRKTDVLGFVKKLHNTDSVKIPRSNCYDFEDGMKMLIFRGDKIDEESGVSHLYHAAFGLMTLDYFDRKQLDE